MVAAGESRNTTTAKPTTRKRRSKIPRQNQTLSDLLFLVASATSSAHSFLSHHDLRLLPSQTLLLESHLSSASLSLSSLLSLLPTQPLPSLSPPPTSPSLSWFHRFLLSSSDYDDPKWVESFRMSKPSFSLLLRLLTPSLSSSLSTPPDNALAAALFRLSHAAPYHSLARRFDLPSSAAACRVFYTVCKAIIDKLGHLFEFKSDIKRIVVGFGWISLPNCCGVLGFDRFPVDGDLLGEDGSLMVQALVDSEGRFLDVSAGWPSTMRPETMLRQSGLFSGVEESRELLDGPCFELRDGSEIPQYILGDSCFPLLPWLLTPFVKSGCSSNNGLNASERAFNSVHREAMELAGMAFGRVRARWKLVSNRWKEECIESFPFVIVTCCLLHNFLIKCSEALPDVNLGDSEDQEVLNAFEGEVDEDGVRSRDALALHLYRVSQRR